MTTPLITSIIAQLPSTCLEQTSRFYRQQLGAREVGRYPELLVLKWDEHELHFWLTSDRTLAAHSSCYLRVRHVAALYAACVAVPGLVQPAHALAARPWGMQEFYIVDPDGNLLKFGEPLEATLGGWPMPTP